MTAINTLLGTVFFWERFTVLDEGHTCSLTPGGEWLSWPCLFSMGSTAESKDATNHLGRSTFLSVLWLVDQEQGYLPLAFLEESPSAMDVFVIGVILEKSSYVTPNRLFGRERVIHWLWFFEHEEDFLKSCSTFKKLSWKISHGFLSPTESPQSVRKQSAASSSLPSIFCFTGNLHRWQRTASWLSLLSVDDHWDLILAGFHPIQMWLSFISRCFEIMAFYFSFLFFQ